MLTSLLTGKLAFKVYNPNSMLWETVTLNNPELLSHAGAKASVFQAGHVQLTNDLTSDSDVLAPTANALKTVFDSVGVHVNEKDIHLTQSQIDMINSIAELKESVQKLQADIESLKEQATKP